MRGCNMEKEDTLKEKTINQDAIFHKGQGVIYKGREAKVINVNPVFIIKIKNNNHVVCGDVLLDDLCLTSV